MREPAKSTTTSRSSGFAILIALALTCTSLSANEEHLPPKAKAVAEKLATFEKTATPEAAKTKRQQVVQYLGALLKEEAAKANLDGALAVKALIAKLDTPAAPAPAKPAAAQIDSKITKTEGLPLEAFSIDRESKRRLEFPFTIKSDHGVKTIRCEIEGASDDSGDGGLEYELIDPGGKVAKQGKLKAQGLDLITLDTRRGGAWKMILTDTDTSFDGNYPGNNGSLCVKVLRAPAKVATANFLNRRPSGSISEPTANRKK